MSIFLKEKLTDKIFPEPNSGCWIWMGYNNPYGYAIYSGTRVHRLSYESYIGAIPDGLVIDHKCRVRCCVNPYHLRCVTNEENVLIGTGPTAENLEKTNCKKGHLLEASNVRVRYREGRMSRADALVELIRGRIHSEHDGECHLTDAEAHAIADFLSEAEQREKDARRVALEEAALWHDAKVQEYTDQIAVNDAYLARGGRLSSESQANEYCDDQRSTHRRSAAYLRSMACRAALERSEGCEK